MYGHDPLRLYKKERFRQQNIIDPDFILLNKKPQSLPDILRWNANFRNKLPGRTASNQFPLRPRQFPRLPAHLGPGIKRCPEAYCADKGIERGKSKIIKISRPRRLRRAGINILNLKS